MNLFTADLAHELTYQMVEQFLRVGDPENERPQESIVLDFNENVPPDIGDAVTAFSNTNGGLVILGVREKKHRQLAIPDAIIGIPDTTVAVQAKIINIIWSTVQPHPLFSVGLIPVDNMPGKIVAVIRIEEGVDTPYMYIGGQKNKISVRVGDSNKTATLGQVKALFTKAAWVSSGIKESQAALGDPYVTRAGSRCGAYHQLTWIPLQLLKIRLDRQTEKGLEESIRNRFIRDRSSELEITRTGTYTDFDAYNRDRDYHRKWRITVYGGISFVSKIGHRGYGWIDEQSDQEIDRVGDWILDALSFMNLTRSLAKGWGYLGNADIKHSMRFAGDAILIKATMAKTGSSGYERMAGVSIPTPIQVFDFEPSKKWTGCLTQLDKQDIAEIVADFFLYQLRHIGGDCDSEQLSREIMCLLNDVVGTLA